MRYSTHDGTVDSLLTFPKGVHYEPSYRTDDGTMRSHMGLGPYGPSNIWTVSPDGRLWLVNAARYEVRVLSRDGAQIFSQSFSSDSIPVSQTGWDAYVHRITGQSTQWLEESVQAMGMKLDAPMPRPPGLQYDVPPAPVMLPPVNSGDGVRQIHTFDDMAWVPVSRVDPPTIEHWDILDMARGARLVTVSRSPHERLLHVSKRGAYIAVKDDDDLERLVLYRSP